MEHHRQTSDLGARLEVPEGAGFANPATPGARPSRLKSRWSDRANGRFGSILALEKSSVTRPDHRDLGLISSAALAHAFPQANKTTASASTNILLVIGPQSLRSAEDGVAQLSAMTTPFSAAAAQPIHFGHAGHPPAADRIANAMTSSKTTDIAAANRPFSGKAPSCWPP